MATKDEDQILDDDDLFPEEIEEKEKEEKKEAKKKAKKEYKEEHGVKVTFNMYKFIIKIFVTAVLVAFGVTIIVLKDETIGAVYLVAGIGIVLTTLIRLFPLLKSTKSRKARIVMFVQMGIHAVIGAYLILAAFIHFASVRDVNNAIAQGTIDKAKTLAEELKALGGFGNNLAAFNIAAFSYILVVFFFTLSVGYYWVTILYDENKNRVDGKPRRTLFWLMTVCNTLAVVLGLLSDKLTAEVLIIVLAVLCLLSAVVIGGEATGGYIQYRRRINATKPKTEEKKKEDTEIKAPGKKEEDYTDIDTNIIPEKDDSDQDSVVM